MTCKQRESYSRYWGKVNKNNDGLEYHLLPFHCLDVVAVADVWLSQSNVLLKQIAKQLDQDEVEAKSIVLFFIALHDLGKFDARFQEFVPEVRKILQGDKYQVEPEPYDHGSFGYSHFRRHYRMNSEPMKAVAGHHGYCEMGLSNLEPSADDELIDMDESARVDWIEYCLNWQGLEDIPDVGDIPMLAGLCSVSDWVGSSMTNFTTNPEIPLMDYYDEALKRADIALRETGMIKPLQGSGFQFLFDGYQPRGVQTLLNKLPLSTGLTLVEADTGSGKTEFALAYASKLIECGYADGVVFGLPTQATANGLYKRIGDAADKLFSDSTVTLAHGKSKYVLESDINGFLYQSNKRAFLGTVSVATIDQILMGVLGIKHQFVRSFGTRKSVLILDEIHSFDAYMVGLIEQVLKGQHAAYSCVILLSATLPRSLKTKLLGCYNGASETESYPLITHVDMAGNTSELTVDADENHQEKIVLSQVWSSENLLPNANQQQQIIDWVKQGAMVGIICNTVNDAQALFEVMKQQSDIEVDLFHARFTFGDRHRIEESVLQKYGKQAKRKGRLLIATQVVEQSLDLDFDVLISQIAPIEFLMQRMGRLWRHDRCNTALEPRATIINEPLFITLAPSLDVASSGWEHHYKGSGYVYRNIRLLYRTQRFLQSHDKLSFPDCYRGTIDYVHNDTAYDEEPEKLTVLVEKYHQEQEGALYAARQNSNLDSKPLADIDPRCAMLTRDGEMSLSVVLTKSDGALLHGGSFQDLEDRDRSTVSLSRKLAKGKRDNDNYCLVAVINEDVMYSELGVTEQFKNL